MTLRLALAAFALAPLAACMAVPDAPQATRAWPEGTPTPLGQPVTVGDLKVTPMRVVEDSRCPKDVTCVWTGRLIVETRIDGEGWRDTANIAVGESYGTHGSVIALVSAQPERTSTTEIPPGEYRFVYKAR